MTQFVGLSESFRFLSHEDLVDRFNRRTLSPLMANCIATWGSLYVFAVGLHGAALTWCLQCVGDEWQVLVLYCGGLLWECDGRSRISRVSARSSLS